MGKRTHGTQKFLRKIFLNSLFITKGGVLQVGGFVKTWINIFLAISKIASVNEHIIIYKENGTPKLPNGGWDTRDWGFCNYLELLENFRQYN